MNGPTIVVTLPNESPCPCELSREPCDAVMRDGRGRAWTMHTSFGEGEGGDEDVMMGNWEVASRLAALSEMDQCMTGRRLGLHRWMQERAIGDPRASGDCTLYEYFGKSSRKMRFATAATRRLDRGRDAKTQIRGGRRSAKS